MDKILNAFDHIEHTIGHRPTSVNFSLDGRWLYKFRGQVNPNFNSIDYGILRAALDQAYELCLTTYPVRIKTSRKFLRELYDAEYGRYEDACAAREAGDADTIDANDYAVVFCDFGQRHKSQIECRTSAELREVYYVCASGLIGVRGYTVQANRVLDQIRETVQQIDAQLVKRWPVQPGY